MTVEQNVRPASRPASRDASRDAGRAAARLCKALELAVGDKSLSLPQYRLLAFLSGGPERATELASWLEVSPPSLTALVDGLVHKGLVERVTSDEDRRCVRHVLTPAGAASLEGGDDAIAERLERLLGFVSPAEARQALAGLGLLGLALDRAREAQREEEIDRLDAAKDAAKKDKIAANAKKSAERAETEVAPTR